MNLFHYFRNVLWILLIYTTGFAVAQANYDWQKFETLLENGQYLVAIEQLDENLKNARAKLDDKEWTLTLLRGARLRAVNRSQGAAVNYLHYAQWPSNRLSQSILNLALAKEYEHYLIGANKSFSTSTGSKKAAKNTSLTALQLIAEIKRHYQLAYDLADKNKLTTKQAQHYLTRGDYPSAVRGNLTDVIVAYWQQFLVDDAFWTRQQKDLLDVLKLSHLLDLSREDSKNLKHPLLRIKQLTQQSIEKHQQNGSNEAIFEAKQYYLQLLTRHFSDNTHIRQLSDFLSEQLAELGPQYPWWTMGQFQLLSLKKKLKQPPSLIEIHDLAVQASIIHTDSLGTKKSQDLIKELEFSEYMITGLRSTGLNKPSIEITFRNLQQLYFRAWQVTESLPIQMDDALKATVISSLLTKTPESKWMAILPDQFDLRKKTTKHHPQINRYGHWLILASPNENFQEAKSALQLISMQFSRYVTNVSYVNEVFNVAVYQGENGTPLPNISVNLLSVEKGVEALLSTSKTDRKGIATLRRKVDANHFRISVNDGEDRTTIDIPGVFPFSSDNSLPNKHRAKSLLMTDKDSYNRGDTIYWSMISRAATNKNNSSIAANSNQKAWLKLFDKGRVIFEKSFITDSTGMATGEIVLSSDFFSALSAKDIVKEPLGIAKRYKMKTSWGGQKAIDIKRHKLFGAETILRDDAGQFNFKRSIASFNKHSSQNTSQATLDPHLIFKNKKPHYSLSNTQSFFVEGEANTLNLIKYNRSLESLGESQWAIYALVPATNSAIANKQTTDPKSSWMIGPVKQRGMIVHDGSGRAALPLKQIESGMYRLRVVPKNTGKQPVFEYDFIVAKNGVSNNLKLSGVLLTENTQLISSDKTLRLLAGSGNSNQWSRLTISKDDRELANQMLSPGIHLLKFPIAESHEGGVNFSLEWVENNQIAHRDIHVEVSWLSKRLSLSINKTAESWRLQALDKQQQALSGPAKPKVILYFTEVVEGDVLPKSLNLDALYWQSRASMMRLNNNGSRYPHYFNSQSKHFPSYISDIVELPQIRYSSNNNELLSGRSDFFITPVETQSSFVANIDTIAQSLSKQRAVKLHKGASTTLANDQQQRLTHFIEASLDAAGGLNIKLPVKLEGKQVHLRAIVVTPELQAGQLSIILR